MKIDLMDLILSQIAMAAQLTPLQVAGMALELQTSDFSKKETLGQIATIVEKYLQKIGKDSDQARNFIEMLRQISDRLHINDPFKTKEWMEAQAFALSQNEMEARSRVAVMAIIGAFDENQFQLFGQEIGTKELTLPTILAMSILTMVAGGQSNFDCFAKISAALSGAFVEYRNSMLAIMGIRPHISPGLSIGALETFINSMISGHAKDIKIKRSR